MHFTNIALLAAVAAALPATTNDPNDGPINTFQLTVDAPGTDINGVGITASLGIIDIGGDQSDVSCQGNKEKFATFAIDVGSKSVKLASNSPPYQTLYIAGGMGDGLIGYTTGTQQLPEDFAQNVFTIDSEKNFLTDGISPKACPPVSGGGWTSWSFWYTTKTNPAGLANCIDIKLKVVYTKHPSDCHYSSS